MGNIQTYTVYRYNWGQLVCVCKVGIEVFHHAHFNQHFRTKGGFSHPKDVFWRVEFKLKVL